MLFIGFPVGFKIGVLVECASSLLSGKNCNNILKRLNCENVIKKYLFSNLISILSIYLIFYFQDKNKR